MGGFWTAETMRQRIAAEELVHPYTNERVVNGAYELSLGPEVYVTSAETDTKRVLADGEQVEIPPGQFANLLTEEIVKVPADAIGLISVRFRLKQRGLVNVSGFHVDPGYSGQLLFSVFNAGPRPVVVARGEPVFLLWFVSFDGATSEEDLYAGAVRDKITSEDVMQLQGAIATPQALAVRVNEVERRLERWRSNLDTAWKAAIAAIVVTAIGWLLAFFGGVFDDGSSSSPTSSTIVTTSSATTSAPASASTTISTSTTGP